MKPGFHAGAYLYYMIKKSSWGVQVEGLYSFKGSKVDFETLAGNFSGDQKLYYLDIPVLVRSHRRFTNLKQRIPLLQITDEMGPRGWNKAVLRLLSENEEKAHDG